MKNFYTSPVRLLAVMIFFSFALQTAVAQTGVKIAATPGPADASAILELSSANKGLLFPRVALVSLTDNINPVNNPATGLVVYNLGTGGVAATGVYFWNGSSWVLLSSGGLSGSGTVNNLAKFTASNAIGNSVITDDGTNVGIGIAIPTQKLQVVGGNVQINNLAGVGMRPVFADANGVLKAVTTTPVFFNYTGADQTYTVPAGVISLIIKIWGAGGGGGNYGGWHSGFSGGGGGFTSGTLAVTPGQVLTIMVGQGGRGGNQGVVTTNTYGGGGRSCGGSDCQYSGQGGGRSAIRISGVEYMTAGGGGGGGSNVNLGWYSTNRGGAGGGLTGQQGECTSVPSIGGGGGTQVAGGIGGQGGNTIGGNGSQFLGGNPGSTQSYGGGGGGGWWGGGAGGYSNGNTMSGGGGGSGYVGGTGVSNGVTMQGNYQYPANTGDVHYQGGIGLGGTTIYPTAAPNWGGNGLVVIIPN